MSRQVAGGAGQNRQVCAWGEGSTGGRSRLDRMRASTSHHRDGSGNSSSRRTSRTEVAIIEGGTFGGTCLNVGCIPRRCSCYAADESRTPSDSSRLGIDAALDGGAGRYPRPRLRPDRPDLAPAARTTGSTARTRPCSSAPPAFSGPRPWRSDRRKPHADQVVIATGSHPVVPAVISRSGVRSTPPTPSCGSRSSRRGWPSSAAANRGRVRARLRRAGVHVTLIGPRHRLLRQLTPISVTPSPRPRAPGGTSGSAAT